MAASFGAALLAAAWLMLQHATKRYRELVGRRERLHRKLGKDTDP